MFPLATAIMSNGQGLWGLEFNNFRGSQFTHPLPEKKRKCTECKVLEGNVQSKTESKNTNILFIAVDSPQN